MENYEDIDLKKCEKQKELQRAEEYLNVVDIADLQMGQEITLLQLKRKDIQMAISKAKLNVKALKLEVSLLLGKFWRAKNV